MKEEWEVSILLALFCLFLQENSPQRKGGHRVIMNNYFISLYRFIDLTSVSSFPLW